MASIVLSTIGTAVGNAVGVPGLGWTGANIVRSKALLGEAQVLTLVDQSARISKLLLNWQQRRPTVFDRVSVLDVPLMETTEQYNIEIIHSGNMVRSWRKSPYKLLMHLGGFR